VPITTGKAGEVDALVVGAGFAGLYQLHRLRKLGLRTRVLERGSGVGGTWFWNRYPGARCDAPSLFYSVSYLPDLDQEWQWTERFAAQPEILAYVEEVARREDMHRDISLETSLISAEWDSGTATWTAKTDTGESITSQYLIMATGCLSASRVPDVAGLDLFQGRWFHTGRWPHEPVDFTGRRVGVVGTGCTGVQVIPAIAQDAEKVIVFQRTPKFVLPAANRPLTEEDARPVKERYPTVRSAARRADFGVPFPPPEHNLAEMSIAARESLMESMYGAGGLGGFVSNYADHLGLKNQEVNDILADFVRKKIREVVNDAETAEALTPYGYPIGINRIILGTGYYQSYNRSNVTLHSVLDDPIMDITETGLKTRGAEFEFDDLIFATGYHAMTGSFSAVDIRGRSGPTIREHWADGPRAYLGMQIADFPNMFMITGPGGPSVLGNVITTTEQSIDFVTGLIEHARANNLGVVETDAMSEAQWMDHVAGVAEGTLYRHAYKANSWYTRVNGPGKKAVFMPYAGGVGTFETVLEDVAADGYRGFHFSRAGGARALASHPQASA
jgi:cation diffusion facilitator CzcD-associated flavoprotein CzcO